MIEANPMILFEVDNELKSALYHACEHKRLKIIEILL